MATDSSDHRTAFVLNVSSQPNFTAGGTSGEALAANSTRELLGIHNAGPDLAEVRFGDTDVVFGQGWPVAVGESYIFPVVCSVQALQVITDTGGLASLRFLLG